MTQITNEPVAKADDVADRSAGTEPPVAEAASAKTSGTNFESLAVASFIFGLFAMVVAVFAVGLAARAVSEAGVGGGGGPAAPGALDVTLADFSIDPAQATIAEGGTINLTNDGNVQHDLVVDGAQSDMLEPGASGTLVLGSVAPGDYTVYCSVPGHREAGMVGEITVK